MEAAASEGFEPLVPGKRINAFETTPFGRWRAADACQASVFKTTRCKRRSRTDRGYGSPSRSGTFGPEPGEVDLTFGPEIKFVSVPQGMKQSRSPFDGLQFYGIGRIDGDTQLLTMSLHDVEGEQLYKIDLEPQV